MTTDPTHTPAPVRRLLLVLGDQLNRDSRLFDDTEPDRDLVWLCEAPAEATHVPSHKARTVLFLSAMRHFRERLTKAGLRVRYLALDAHEHPGIDAALAADLDRLQPDEVCLVQPGEHRLHAAIAAVCARAGVPLRVLEDGHFLCPLPDFASWAEGRKELRLEHFYRWMRKRHDVLMDDGAPAGGAWNFDKDNRKTFGKQGPGLLPAPLGFAPDAVTQEVMQLVEERFADAPGGLDHFDWPVTPAQAQAALTDFIDHRLAAFGPYQDAIWTGEPYLYHARLSAALNLKLLDPRDAIDAAVAAYRAGRAPIASVEGFVRQILGWREYVRGIYWQRMPGYLERNALDAHQPLPAFYWSGDTDYACLADAVGQVVARGYGHHIQRLMVTGLFALLLGVEPKQVHAWYLAMFVDAVEWVEAPNTLGMSQFADDGLLASKPYAASGAYIQRMSNCCADCRYDPKQAVGETACPFTTLFWDFLARHRERFSGHPRTALMWRNLERLEPARLQAIRTQAAALRDALAAA
ncbi:cryptochrome/photolyase family protein [uncultured Thiohalocapsa sp.]|uniref:cryptochrome/photolyase family protein n=1 Tax=uncultured Thiohalocapsa sp. TaxID=768990 RepID=UPI0025F0C984|nr:cryptochrome/photolyase family protein [uncultured Thiohalocapsa sp.]